MSMLKYWLWLSAETELSPRAKTALVEHYGDPERAWFAPIGEFSKIPGLSQKDAQILERRDVSRNGHIMSECGRLGLDILTLQDAGYPSWLKNIPAPPLVLYIKGRLPNVDEGPAIAIVGTRKASPYGEKQARRLAFEIVGCGGIIVSGLTAGVDRSAAVGCLLAGGECIGVLGTPHGEDGGLYADVAARGALISEYAPGTPVQKHFFRDRNRISSGLSRGVVVVEAPEKSGSLLFATEALEQGREIFAVPGSVDSENSVGTIALLKQGAKPVSCGWDVMAEFKPIFPERVKRPDGRAETVPDAPTAMKKREKQEEKAKEIAIPAKKVIDNGESAGYIDISERFPDLSEVQQSILQAVGKGETLIDDIIERTGLSASQVLSELTMLELKGCIRRCAGRRICIN